MDQLRRASFTKESLVLLSSELLLEPVNHVLERIVVLLVEEVASWLHFYKLFHQFFLGHVSKDNILRVLVENSELVRNSGCIFLLFSLNALFELLDIVGLDELWMLENLS